MSEGLTLDPLGVGLYFGILFVWSGFIAYLIVFGRGASPTASVHSPKVYDPVSHPQTKMHGIAPPPKSKSEPAKAFRGYSAYDGFKSFATSDTLTIEDIVQGLARESGAHDIHDMEISESPHEESVHEHDPERAASVAQANEFLQLLVDGERDGAYEVLREIEETGEGAEPFLRRVLGAVESALNSRLHGATCDLRVLEILGGCDTPVIERLANALATAEGKHGGKLALTRAFNALTS